MNAQFPEKGESVSLFENHREALFVRRPNRFLIIARDGEEELTCHCPNPGRLLEFTFPGTRLILEKRKDPRGKVATAWTVAGLYYRDTAVPFFSSRINRAAEKLILKKIIPGLQDVRAESIRGTSRFDFLCTLGPGGQRHLVEVKACSLIEYGVAMFPDAPSGRALKHLKELAALAEEGFTCHMLFVIVHSEPHVFIPNLHTDPLFAAALSRYAGKVNIHAALCRCNNEGRAVLAGASVPVDLSHGGLAESNRGNYLAALEIPKEAHIKTGGLGELSFAPGWYVYAGSAQKNLSQRMARHLRKTRKAKHWHIDYLTPAAKTIKALPILSYRNLECDLARSLGALGGKAIPGFGSSDCRCASHLYYFTGPPLGNRAFVDMLFRFRHVEALRQTPPIDRS
ncbi:MAG: DNA/RNA nuclease SfsA [Treponema sp.]|jgi:sugar fermentation stimulation protein A|nr:DNA/RNA nuclease SfsA [Treponema sp.]